MNCDQVFPFWSACGVDARRSQVPRCKSQLTHYCPACDYRWFTVTLLTSAFHCVMSKSKRDNLYTANANMMFHYDNGTKTDSSFYGNVWSLISRSNLHSCKLPVEVMYMHANPSRTKTQFIIRSCDPCACFLNRWGTHRVNNRYSLTIVHSLPHTLTHFINDWWLISFNRSLACSFIHWFSFRCNWLTMGV